MMEEGAAIVDVGGESTRPGSGGLSLDEELRRVVPVLERLEGVPLSIDTSKAEVARRPYSKDADAGGTWSAPDLARARQLVRQSGTAGARVTFWAFKIDGRVVADAEVARETFTQLGYRYSQKIFPDAGAYYQALGKASTSEPSAGVNGWLADYPAASNFFEPMSCTTVGDAAANSSRFCSAAFDRKLEHANAVQTQDPGAAANVWRQMDHDATDQAIWVSTFTPRSVDLVSKRVGNYQHHPIFGVLLDQLWVR
jgi:peptide/nickel transport system substrate-binding protein